MLLGQERANLVLKSKQDGNGTAGASRCFGYMGSGTQRWLRVEGWKGLQEKGLKSKAKGVTGKGSGV